LYLATVIDCHTKGVVGWAMDDNYKTPLISAAIDMAARNNTIASDRAFYAAVLLFRYSLWTSCGENAGPIRSGSSSDRTNSNRCKTTVSTTSRSTAHRNARHQRVSAWESSHANTHLGMNARNAAGPASVAALNAA
jgi:hypothetical protein